MASKRPQRPQSVDEFLSPLHIDDTLVLNLSREMTKTFIDLSATSQAQFLPTPISESLLRRVSGADCGR